MALEASDASLIERCRGGDASAYEPLVRRYQVLVCSIAYSIVGRVAVSEEIGQDAFLLAWKNLPKLNDPTRFKSWLSTITRNRARAWLKQQRKLATEIETPNRIPAVVAEERSVDREEAALVWETLGKLPETYREPLVLFYRHDRSIAEVAEALTISEAAAKQRLSRGRKMLREEVIERIARSLRKSSPASTFTVAVMSIVAASSKPAAAASAATVSAATVWKAASLKSALGGGLVGSAVGLAGGFLGGFASWYNAEYPNQRTLIVRQGRVYLVGMSVFMLPFLAMYFGWRPTETLGMRGYQIAHALWMCGAMLLNFAWIFWTLRSHRQLERRNRQLGLERLPRFHDAGQELHRRPGYQWQSRTVWWGLPLIQVAIPDGDVGVETRELKRQGQAHAWIAMGHHARGRLLAIGHRAFAPIAIGNQAFGIAAFGLIACGAVSMGIVAIAPLSLGVVSIGLVALGAAIGIGGWCMAPMAFAFKAAKGALAASLGYAVGPSAFAPHQNDEVAIRYIESSPWIQWWDGWLMYLAEANRPHGSTSTYLVLAIVGISLFVQHRWRRRKDPVA